MFISYKLLWRENEQNNSRTDDAIQHSNYAFCNHKHCELFSLALSFWIFFSLDKLPLNLWHSSGERLFEHFTNRFFFFLLIFHHQNIIFQNTPMNSTFQMEITRTLTKGANVLFYLKSKQFGECFFFSLRAHCLEDKQS